MRKLALSLCLLALSVTWLSCGGSYSAPNPSKVKFRAVISNSLHPVTAGVNIPALEIMDATTDKLSFTPIGLSGLTDLSSLDVASNKALTLAYSPSGHMFELVNNATEQASGNPVTIPGATESFFLANNTLHVYAAVPDLPMPSGTPGAIIQVGVSSGQITATIPVPHVRFVREVSRGDSILAFGDDCVTIITAANIGTSIDPRTKSFCGLDHPVGAGVSDNLTLPAILVCGRECGGTSDPAIIPLDLSTNTLGTPVPVAGATVALGVGNTLYVAGTPTSPSIACTSGTAATVCGTLTVVDLTGAKAPQSVEIPDGHHNKMEVTTDGQVAVGSEDCTEISTSTETRGCLAIYNPATGKVAIPSFNGNVTGLAPVPGRKVLYAIQGGSFVAYDTTTNKFLPGHQTAIVGELVDVKIIDNPPN